MVYELKCSECGKIIDFGSGEEPEDLPGKSIRWDGKVYCQECVKAFVKLGVGNVRSRVEYLENKMEQASEALGFEFSYPEER